MRDAESLAEFRRRLRESDQRKGKRTKASFARKMREYNLTHGRGCKAIARAIEKRTGHPAIGT